MRDQYAGDLSDVLKFGLLRALAGKDRRLGIAWYYVPGHDGRADGRHLEWRDEEEWRLLDRKLYDELAALPERNIAALEKAAIWPDGTIFHGDPVPSSLGRRSWAEHKRRNLENADIVFLDPDNGLGMETPKHATFSEIRLLRRPGRAIAFITFPGRNMKHGALVHRLHERLAVEGGASKAITLRTSVLVPRAGASSSYVPRQRWFTVIDADAELTGRVQTFTKTLSSIPRVRAKLEFVT